MKPPSGQLRVLVGCSYGKIVLTRESFTSEIA